MERVVKFMGKTNGDTGAWVIGYYHYDKSVNKHFICSLEKLIRYEIIKESIGQFTGQLDKNKNDIYEGHIMKGLFGTGMGGDSTRYKQFYFKIIFYETRGFIIDMPKNYGKYRFLPYLSSCEIVSTVYENPELLG